jgi:hypothetical protein
MARTRHHGDKAKQQLFGKAWRWTSQTPRWWNRLYHHKPARRKERDRLTETLRGEEPTDWPDHRKPHIYFH